MITPSRLLKSCAIPPDSRPTASIFTAMCSCRSSTRFSVALALFVLDQPPAAARFQGSSILAFPFDFHIEASCACEQLVRPPVLLWVAINVGGQVRVG